MMNRQDWNRMKNIKNVGKQCKIMLVHIVYRGQPSLIFIVKSGTSMKTLGREEREKKNKHTGCHMPILRKTNSCINSSLILLYIPKISWIQTIEDKVILMHFLGFQQLCSSITCRYCRLAIKRLNNIQYTTSGFQKSDIHLVNKVNVRILSEE